jgi:hypothetical protein
MRSDKTFELLGKSGPRLNASVKTNESSMERPIMKKLELNTSDQILQVALAREKEARDFYDEQAVHCRVDFVKKLLEKLNMRNPNIFAWCRV